MKSLTAQKPLLLIFLSFLYITGCAPKAPEIKAFPDNLSEADTVIWMNELCQKYGGMTQVVGTEKI